MSRFSRLSLPFRFFDYHVSNLTTYFVAQIAQKTIQIQYPVLTFLTVRDCQFPIQTSRWRITPSGLSATAYSQLPFIFGCRILRT
jgi:hypothetical protein